MKDGILQKRLQGKFQNKTIQQRFLLRLYLHGDGTAVTIALYGKIILRQGKLLPDGNQKASSLGNTSQKLCQGSRHLGNAGGALDVGHPFDGIQGIIQKMRIDLALEHFVLQIFLLLFVFQPCLHQQKDIFTQIVDAPADIADFVTPFNGRIPLKIPLLHTQHFGPDL